MREDRSFCDEIFSELDGLQKQIKELEGNIADDETASQDMADRLKNIAIDAVNNPNKFKYLVDDGTIEAFNNKFKVLSELENRKKELLV